MELIISSSLKMPLNHPNPNQITNYNHIIEKRTLILPSNKHKKCMPLHSLMQTNSSVNTNTSPSFTNILNPPLHPSVDPNHVFTGNFAPVDELGQTVCQVIYCEIPVSLTGTYIRNGSNPQHIPNNGPLHFFEGDGMLHSIQLSQGQAIYSSRYVKTYKYMLEKDAGSAIFSNVFSGFYGLAHIIQCVVSVLRVLIGHINLKKGFGLANTSLALFSSKLLALGESDLPYIMNLTQEGDIKTMGRWDFDKKLFANMTAHPKTDMVTKETFAFKCSPFFPYLTFFRFDENGVKQKDVPILSMDRPTYFHDFAITERFAIFSETQLAISLVNLMFAKGVPVVSDPAKVPRIGIISRYATSDEEMKWFSVQGFNALHIINAWENGDDEIVLIAPSAKSLENVFHNIDKVHFSLEKVRINIRTGDISRKILSARNLEMGCINSSYIGKRNRYVYLGVGEEIPKMAGVVKIDLQKETEVSIRFYGQGCYGGEPLFVPRNGQDDDPETDEDDGFVVSYVHDESCGASKFVIMDAKSPNLDILAAIKMPRRVPYGFHGLYVHGEIHPNA